MATGGAGGGRAIAGGTIDITAPLGNFERSMRTMTSRLRSIVTQPVRIFPQMDLSGFHRSANMVKYQLQAMAVRFGARAIVGGAVDTLRTAVIGASDLNEAVTKTQQVFGASFGVISAGADEVGRKFGVVRKEYLDSASAIGLIGKASGMSQAAAAGLANQMTRLALDASSFFNTSIEESMIAFRAGLVGESEPLRRFGVLLSEAAVKQEALTLGLAKGKGELSEGVKVQARASIIMRQMGDAQGDLQRTSGGFANQLKIISGRWTNLLTSIGTRVLPAFQTFAAGVSRLLEGLDDYLQRNGGFLDAWAERAANAVWFVGMAWKEFPRFIQIATNVIAEKFTQIQEIFQRIGEGLGIAWHNAMGTIGTKIAQGLNYLKNLFTGFAEFLSSLFSTIGANLAAHLQNAIVDTFASPKMKGALQGLAVSFPALNGLAAVAAMGKVAVPGIHGNASGLTESALDKNKPKDFETRTFDHLLTPLENFSNAIEDIVMQIRISGAKDVFKEVTQPFRDALRARRKPSAAQQLFDDNVRRGLPAEMLDEKAAARVLAARARNEKMGRAGVGNAAVLSPEERAAKAAEKDAAAQGRKAQWAADAAERDAAANARRDQREAEAKRAAAAQEKLRGLTGTALLDQIRRNTADRKARLAPGMEPAAPGRFGRNFGGANFGGAGQVLAAGARQAREFAMNMFANGQVANLAGMGLAFGVGGVQGLLADQPKKAGGRRVRYRQRGGAGGFDMGDFSDATGGPVGFHGLAEFQKMIQTSMGGKDDPAHKQVGLLETIAEGIGTRGAGVGSPSVIGQLSKLAARGAGPGFTT